MVRMSFASLGLLLAGFLAAAEPAQPKIPLPGVDPRMPYFMECSRACADCARLCEVCSAHCARALVNGKKEHLATLRLCQDCAAVCSAASAVVARDGPLVDVICTACADACKRCGDACEKLAADPIMKACAEECRNCEKACREMVRQAAVAKPAEKK